jgi:hypothetical protein
MISTGKIFVHRQEFHQFSERIWRVPPRHFQTDVHCIQDTANYTAKVEGTKGLPVRRITNLPSSHFWPPPLYGREGGKNRNEETDLQFYFFSSKKPRKAEIDQD